MLKQGSFRAAIVAIAVQFRLKHDFGKSLASTFKNALIGLLSLVISINGGNMTARPTLFLEGVHGTGESMNLAKPCGIARSPVTSSRSPRLYARNPGLHLDKTFCQGGWHCCSMFMMTA